MSFYLPVRVVDRTSLNKHSALTPSGGVDASLRALDLVAANLRVMAEVIEAYARRHPDWVAEAKDLTHVPGHLQASAQRIEEALRVLGPARPAPE